MKRRCNPPTCGIAVTALGIGGSTSRGIGAASFSPM